MGVRVPPLAPAPRTLAISTYFDTHAHFEDNHAAIEAMLDEAADVGVGRIVAVGGSPALNQGAITAKKLRPNQVLLALGFDREQALLENLTFENVKTHLRDRPSDDRDSPLAAVGEIGLDYHYHVEGERRRRQRELMECQLEIAAELRRPVIIHTREADEDTVALLRNAQGHEWFRGERPGVIHCFTGTEKFAAKMLELGYYISFSGIVTFANAKALRRVAAMVPEQRLLIETDTPYLTPVPLRGKPNRPAYVVHVAECLAEQRGMEVDAVAALTAANAERLFGGEGEAPKC